MQEVQGRAYGTAWTASVAATEHEDVCIVLWFAAMFCAFLRPRPIATK
jgi:hypothetical protein